MPQNEFSRDRLRDWIESAYFLSENTLGWRFLYSSEHVLDGARIAFIGLNPGGSRVEKGQSDFAVQSGSAYRDESWAGCDPGQSKLQRQVLALFERLEVQPEDVLAGNLVPFRSPDWASLHDKAEALRFGVKLWTHVLSSANPSIVVTMGAEVTRAVASILEIKDLERHLVGWGRVSGQRGEFLEGTLIGLPHLSRFGVMTREASASKLNELFSAT